MDGPAPTTSPLVRRYRLDEFFALEPPRGGGHRELIGGVLYRVPPPRWSHSVIASRLMSLLYRWHDAHPGSGVLLSPRAAIFTDETYLEPDMFMIAAERLRMLDPEHLTTADLVVEIMSPSTAVYDRTTKADTYAALDVRELWLVDVERQTIEQRALAEGAWRTIVTAAGATPVASTTFPSLTIVPADVFA